MKKFILTTSIIIFCNICRAQIKDGTYLTYLNNGAEQFLSIRILNDTVLAFGNSVDTTSNPLDFSSAQSAGIAYLRNGKWIGVIDKSGLDHMYGDFTEKEKKAGKGFFATLQFIAKPDSLIVEVVNSNFRGLQNQRYRQLNSKPLSFQIRNTYKRMLLADLIYTTLKETPLFFLPEELLPKQATLKAGETVLVQNEYKEYVFIVKYNNKGLVVASGWVKRRYIKFVKQI